MDAENTSTDGSSHSGIECTIDYPLQHLAFSTVVVFASDNRVVDRVDTQTRSWIMGRVKSRGSKAELAVFSALANCGARSVTYEKDLPGCPDITFPELKLAVFVNGCFWHWHGCSRSRMPVSNRPYWRGKIAANQKRDSRALRKLNAIGWHYTRIWECSIPAGVNRTLRAIHNLKGALPS